MKSITQAETLRDNLAVMIADIKESGEDMRFASWGSQDGVLITGEDAEMFLGLLSEWIETTKNLIAGPETAADVNETNAARVQTRMKYKFVRVGKGVVVCVPKQEYQQLWEQHQSCIAKDPTPDNKRQSLDSFLNACAEYPPAVYLDFE